jgi:hypothetical protein
VNLTWTAPTSGTPTDYVVSYSTSSTGTFTTYADGVSTTTSAVVSGLTNGTTYYFKVAAVVGGVTTGTNRVSGGVTPATTPGAPTGIWAYTSGADVILYWSAPSNNGGAEVNDYVVQYATSVSGPFSTFADGTTSYTGATITGLAGATEYFFRVAAANSMGSSSFAAALTTVTTTSCADGGTCAVGDTGPAGGKVIYARSTAIALPGLNETQTYKYIEAAPTDLVTQGTWTQVPWGCGYQPSNPYSCEDMQTDVYDGNWHTGMGYGYFNTNAALIIPGLDANTAVSSAVNEYTINSNGVQYSDWYLPSKDELQAMSPLSQQLGLTPSSYYWSSTEWESFPQYYSYVLDVASGQMVYFGKQNYFYVRPVRYFG